MVNMTWGILQQTWADGIGSLFGTNLLTIGAFFMLFSIWLIMRYGISLEVAAPFLGVMIFILAALNTGQLPIFAWAAFVIMIALLAYAALRRFMG